MKTELHALPAASAGTTRHVRSLHFGEPGRGPKAYIHAALHADEVPAMLVAQHLRQRLLELTEKGVELERQLTERQRARIARAYREAGAEAVEGFRKVMLGLVDEGTRGRFPGRLPGRKG